MADAYDPMGDPDEPVPLPPLSIGTPTPRTTQTPVGNYSPGTPCTTASTTYGTTPIRTPRPNSSVMRTAMPTNPYGQPLRNDDVNLQSQMRTAMYPVRTNSSSQMLTAIRPVESRSQMNTAIRPVESRSQLRQPDEEKGASEEKPRKKSIFKKVPPVTFASGSVAIVMGITAFAFAFDTWANL